MTSDGVSYGRKSNRLAWGRLPADALPEPPVSLRAAREQASGTYSRDLSVSVEGLNRV